MNSHAAAPETRRVAVIGAGPAGLFTAQGLTTQDRVPVEVDIYDRLPAPYGLLRYGVAPDHESIKSVADALAQVFEHPNVRFCGFVEFGQGLTRREALLAYDAIVYAAGAAEDMRMHIPGEMVSGSTSAREFVAWYGGHPDARPFNLSHVTSAVAVGVGNVAVDVARILLKPAGELDWTDMPQDVLDELRRSPVRDVWIIGRRGPQHAAYTTKELRELCDIPGITVSVSEGAFEDIDESVLDRRRRTNLEVLRAAVARDVPEPRAHLHFEFWARPVEIGSTDVNGREQVSHVVLEGTRIDGARLVGTGQTRTIPAQLVMRAIGYRGTPLPDVPFDLDRGLIPNDGGRVVTTEGEVCPQEYTAGWIKRGPIGVVGTNKSDAAETVANLIDDLAAAPPRPHLLDAHQLMRARGFQPTTLEDWQRIDAAERGRGEGRGRERTKVSLWHELIDLAVHQRPDAGLDEATGGATADGPTTGGAATDGAAGTGRLSR